MRRAPLAFVAAGILAGLAPPALAQAAASDSGDVRCMLVLQTVAKDPKQREAAAKGIYFYTGRLSAHGPLARVTPLMVAEAKKMNTPAIIQGELTRCGGELSRKTSELQEVSQRLQKELGPPPAASAAPVAKQ